jgi:Leucine-rich repeat (LRR) protein
MIVKTHISSLNCKVDLKIRYPHLYVSDFFRSTPNVKELILAKNKLKQLPEGIALLLRLKRLDLSENPLKYVYNHEEIFSRVIYNLTELQSLILSNTPLKSLNYLYGLLGPQETDSYSARVHLLELNVSFCGIKTLSDVSSIEIFNEQTSLQIINLSGNTISTIPPQLFDTLSDLRYLNISYLNLTEGPKLELAPNRIMEYIDISHNKLTNPGNVLASGAVMSLDLSFNEIKQWQETDVFTCKSIGSKHTHCFNSSEIPPDPSSVCNFIMNTVWVKYINLSHNALTTVPAQMGVSLNRLTEVDLGCNPFICNICALTEFQKWLLDLGKNNVTSTEYVTLGMKRNLSCTEPFDFIGSFIHDVDFDPKSCIREPKGDWMFHVIIVSTIIFMVITILVPLYIYRYEVTYLYHLAKVMRNRRATGMKTSAEDFEYDAFVCYRYCNDSRTL